ncbi:MAG TPA: sodium:proton antiporter [candidate division Zixibacteria bacterium]|nr:sodium:proton antiporter [candidate division Zixibacteria bacterium]
MSHEMILGLASIIVLGICSQWLAWRFHLPAILLLLVSGLLAGPIGGILRPDALFGELLFPIVSVSVALILFEGGLSLHFRELRSVGRVILSLTSYGLIFTWLAAALAAHWLAGVDLRMAALGGAILTVSGPTVIVPLLRQIRPIGSVASIAKWEGIVNDPIGAILAVVVFNVLAAGTMENGAGIVIKGVLLSLVVGAVFGILAAAVMVLLLKTYSIPDYLQNPMSLMLVVAIYVAADYVQPETGLAAVTVMGIALANQHFVSIRQIVEFKENLRVILISSLFIILAARLTLADLAVNDLGGWMFVAFLILIVRPLTVLISSVGSKLNWREKLFLSWMAPRGIVAAAVVSVFAIHLAEIGFPETDRLVSLIFKVILGTVAVYGLTAPVLARRLGVARPDPQGVLFAGAHPLAQQLALALKAEGFPTVLVDTNFANVTEARQNDLKAYITNILAEDLHYDVPLEGIGRLLSMTPNDEVNALAGLHFIDLFGRSQIYQLPPVEMSRPRRDTRRQMAGYLRGRYLFGDDANYTMLRSMLSSGAVVKKTQLSEEFTWEDFRALYGEQVVLAFVIPEPGRLRVNTSESELEPQPGQTVICLVYPLEGDKGVRR